MTDLSAIRIAVVADSSLQRHLLQTLLLKTGYQVVLNSAPQQLQREHLEACKTDLWLYDAATEHDCIALEYFLTAPSAPVLFGEGAAPQRHSDDYLRWERSVLKKITDLTEHLAAAQRLHNALAKQAQSAPRIAVPQRWRNQPSAATQAATQVWLLAASMGGPAAVKTFLDCLPQGLPVGFLYAQHIDASFEGNLPQAVGRHSDWPVRLWHEYPKVRVGEVVVVPIQHVLNFAANGSMQGSELPWEGPYSPSIEQMMSNLAQHYGKNCGVIVFSGMGSDGSRAAAYVQQQGAPVWTQNAESCACSSMPDSVREAGHSTLSAAPEALAHALVQYLLGQDSQYNDAKKERP